MKFSISENGIYHAELSISELCARALRGYGKEITGVGVSDSEYGSLLRKKIGEHLISMTKEKNAGCKYLTEIPLTCTVEFKNINVKLNGMADGVTISSDGSITVDEYRTSGYWTSVPSSMHMARLKCYAYILCKKYNVDKICTRNVCLNPTTENSDADISKKIKIYENTFSVSMLEASVFDLLEGISSYLHYECVRKKYVIPSAENVPFPYKELREGQKELITEGYSCIKRGKRFFVQAPTGIGKTISTLYPAVRALGNGYCDKIFYLTAKSSTRREAYHAAEKLFKAGAMLRTIVLSPKNLMCLCASNDDGVSRSMTECDADSCPFTKGYGRRAAAAIDELLSMQNCFTRGAIVEAAKKYGVCPYELSLDLSELCDLVICDYNYVFDPVVYLRRYFSEDAYAKGRFVFLADEAHNLPERARSMYSASISLLHFVETYKRLPDKCGALAKWFSEAIHSIRRLYANCKNDIMKDQDGKERAFVLDRSINMDLIQSVSNFSEKLGNYLLKVKGDPEKRFLREFNFELRKFLRVAEIYDDAFLCYTEIADKDIIFKIFCLDPAHPIERCLEKAVSSTFFSATLTPPDYFSHVLGGKGDSVTLSLPSPFPKENLFIAAVTGISTRFEDRKASIKKVANIIAHSVTHRRGNYIVYFPSYSYMKEVVTVFTEKFPNVSTIVQKPNMTPNERNRFIDFFPEDKGKLRIGFCVLGGSFSEGIDLPGTRLIGTVIVGLGLPGLSSERNIIRDYYENKFERGYDYAYTYPGMNNVLQAAGRVIRTDVDEGIVVLIDDRYETELYKSLYPEQWSHIKLFRTHSELSDSVKKFWENK